MLLSFTFLIIAIILLKESNFGDNFLITFILALVSIVISISFFIKSDDLSTKIRVLVKEVNFRLQNVEKKMEGNSNISSI